MLLIDSIEPGAKRNLLIREGYTYVAIILLVSLVYNS